MVIWEIKEGGVSLLRLIRCTCLPIVNTTCTSCRESESKKEQNKSHEVASATDTAQHAMKTLIIQWQVVVATMQIKPKAQLTT